MKKNIIRLLIVLLVFGAFHIDMQATTYDEVQTLGESVEEIIVSPLAKVAAAYPRPP